MTETETDTQTETQPDTQRSGLCATCRSPRATLVCDACKDSLCKACDQLTHARLDEFPAELAGIVHACSGCFVTQIEPALEAYADLLRQAREIHVFTTNQKASLPILKRAKETISIEGHTDRDSATLELALQAVRLGYNALIEADIVSRKVRDEGYQKMAWSIRARPATLDVERFLRRNQD